MSKNTRHAILDILKREGPQDAGSLARKLEITPMAIGLQLAALEEEKIVEQATQHGQGVLKAPSRRGRPMRLWKLSETAHRVFPDAHALLTVGLLQSLQEVYGKKGIEKLLEVRTKQSTEEYRKNFPSEGSLKDKVQALAQIRDREGYMTEVKSTPSGGYLLIENHCPICTAAKTCQGICDSEKSVFQNLMGEQIEVTREEHLLAGNRRCVYGIHPQPSSP